MIEQGKDVPENVIRIQQAWIKAINRVAEALAYRYRNDNLDKFTQQAGVEMVIESVVALYSLLVDYGEATVRSDVSRWRDEHDADFKKKGSEGERMRLYRRWFEYMVQTMNRYGLLFDSMPRGYTNVEMEVI